MTDPAPDDDHAPLESLRRAVLAAAEELAGVGAGAGGRTPITLERPRRAEFGDYSTNAALLIAPGAGVPLPSPGNEVSAAPALPTEALDAGRFGAFAA